ncbi:MAG: hypothetical protein GY898_21895 [Proteobacteria bacterium]|nr:hypothetical protein [Pseudomonadota bacterium]
MGSGFGAWFELVDDLDHDGYDDLVVGSSAPWESAIELFLSSDLMSVEGFQMASELTDGRLRFGVGARIESTHEEPPWPPVFKPSRSALTSASRVQTSGSGCCKP